MTWLLVTRRPLGPAMARLSLIPRHPYSAVPFPSNWQLWRNFPDAMQQTPKAKRKLRKAKRKLRNGSRILRAVSTLMTHPRVYTGTAAINAGWRCAQYDGIVARAAGEHFGRRLRGEFNGGPVIGRGDRLSIGRSRRDRVRNPDQRIRIRPYPDRRG